MIRVGIPDFTRATLPETAALNGLGEQGRIAMYAGQLTRCAVWVRVETLA